MDGERLLQWEPFPALERGPLRAEVVEQPADPVLLDLDPRQARKAAGVVPSPATDGRTRADPLVPGPHRQLGGLEAAPVEPGDPLLEPTELSERRR